MDKSNSRYYRTIKVTVTAEDIAAGKKRCIGNCPVALALRRVAKAGKETWAGVDELCIDKADSGYGTHVTPAAVVSFMERFDMGLPVEPFTFTAHGTRIQGTGSLPVMLWIK